MGKYKALADFIGVLALIAVGISIYLVWFVPDRYQTDFDPATLEHLTHEEIGLPPHYWAYLRHSWEWSDLHDPETAEAALTASIQVNEPRSVFNMAYEVLRKQQCDVLDQANQTEFILEAFSSVEQSDLVVYEFLRWLCFYDDPRFSVDENALHDAIEDDRLGISPVVKLIEVGKNNSHENDFDRIDRFSEVLIENWFGNYFVIEYYFKILKRNFPDYQKYNMKFHFYGDTVFRKIRNYHDKVRFLKYRFVPVERGVGSYVKKFRRKPENYSAAFSNIAKNMYSFCAWGAGDDRRRDICVWGAGMHHLSCSALLTARTQEPLFKYAACRERFIDYHGS